MVALRQVAPGSYALEFEAAINQNTYGPLITSALLEQDAIIYAADRNESAPNSDWTILITTQNTWDDPKACVLEAIEVVRAELQEISASAPSAPP